MAKPKNLTELLRRAVRDNPKASQKELHDICLRATVGDAEMHLALFEYWFGNSYRDFTVAQLSEGSIAIIPNTRAARPDAQKHERERATERLKNELKVCLLDHLLSDGTPIRDATFGQCAKDGGWLIEIAKHGKAGEIVGKKLKESDLQNLLKRFTSRKRAA